MKWAAIGVAVLRSHRRDIDALHQAAAGLLSIAGRLRTSGIGLRARRPRFRSLGAVILSWPVPVVDWLNLPTARYPSILSSILPTAGALPGGMRCHLAELAAGLGKLIVIETLARD